ncbi:MAG: anti-sigma factor [Bacteroidetes bacterium]|nr:MAG: anti-sigma factor [Bacteroidota bacterium]
MNEQAYIQSGAIEACVAGLATQADWQELEQMCAQYPAVLAERTRLELEQENQHLQAAVAPPAALRQLIMSQLPFASATPQAQPATPAPVPTQATVKALPPQPPAVPVLPITTGAPKSVIWLRGAIAASIIMLMGSVALNFYFYSQSAQHLASYKALVAQQTSMVAKNEAMQASFNMMRSPLMKTVPMMPASPKTDGAMATVYWHTATKDVYVLINNLPSTQPEKQYQLWAIVDGKPVDAGTIDMDNQAAALVKMKNIPRASAFAITLEKKGGNPTPTEGAMMVFGAI